MDYETRSYHLRECVVALIDALGQKQVLQQVTEWPDTPEARNRVVTTLGQTIDFIYDLREQFRSFVGDFKSSFLNPKSLDRTEAKLYRLAGQHEVILHAFSDTVVITVPINEDNDYLPSMTGLAAALTAACSTWLWALSKGHCLRGGMELGWCAQMGPSELYGPALWEAYNLEDNVAEHPRLVVGPKLESLLNHVAALEKDTAEAEVSRGLAQMSRALLTLDEEVLMVDFLGGEFSRLSTRLKDRQAFLETVLVSARTFVQETYQRLQPQGHTRILAKYEWLQSYFQRTSEFWPEIQNSSH